MRLSKLSVWLLYFCCIVVCGLGAEPKLEFAIALDKDRLLLGEPLTITYSVRNGGRPLRVEHAFLTGDGVTLYIRHADEPEFREAMPVRKRLSHAPDTVVETFPAGLRTAKETLINNQESKYFGPEALHHLFFGIGGKYYLKAELNVDDELTVASNVLTVDVREPTGEDAGAWALWRDPIAIWVMQMKTLPDEGGAWLSGAEKLQRLVEQFPRSTYAAYARTVLTKGKIPRAAVEAALEYILVDTHHPPLVIGGPPMPREPTKEELVLGVATRIGLPQADLREILMKLIEKGVVAAQRENENQPSSAETVARSALSVMARLGDASHLRRFSELALRGPKALSDSAARPALYIGLRAESPDVPELVQRIVRGSDHSLVYHYVDSYVESELSPEPAKRLREHRLAMKVLREGLLNSAYKDKTFLDQLLEKHDPAFLASDERRQALLALSRSENAFEKKYAAEKLSAFPK